jgi:site-specific recombinase XerD
MYINAGATVGKYGKMPPVGDSVYSLVGKDLCPHCLRHTFCTDALLSGVPIQDVATMMGHENIMTTEIYNSHPPAALEMAREKLSAYHSGITFPMP